MNSVTPLEEDSGSFVWFSQENTQYAFSLLILVYPFTVISVSCEYEHMLSPLHPPSK